MFEMECETCEGCVHLEDSQQCGNTATWEMLNRSNPSRYEGCVPPPAYDDTPACSRFQPSLECRQVIALERIATYLQGRADDDQ